MQEALVLDELDRKLIGAFPGRVVHKDCHRGSVRSFERPETTPTKTFVL